MQLRNKRPSSMPLTRPRSFMYGSTDRLLCRGRRGYAPPGGQGVDPLRNEDVRRYGPSFSKIILMFLTSRSNIGGKRRRNSGNASLRTLRGSISIRMTK